MTIDDKLRARWLMLGRKRLKLRPHELSAFEAELAREDAGELLGAGALRSFASVELAGARIGVAMGDAGAADAFLLELIDTWSARRQPIEPLPPGAGAHGETAEQRQNRLLQACIDAGPALPTSPYGRLPDGIGALAKSMGLTRQALSRDVKAALKRRGTQRTK